MFRILLQTLTAGKPEGMSTNMLVQYTAVGLILAAACVWVIVRVVHRARKGPSDSDCTSCPSCALKEKCSSPNRGEKQNRQRPLR